MTGCDCSENTDPHRLVREGTHQAARSAPDPENARVDQRRPQDAMVFASAYARYLRYFALDDQAKGDWQEFFASDVSAQLAVVAVENVSVYRTELAELLRSLENPQLPADGAAMKIGLGKVFDCIGTLALRLDTLKEELPTDLPLKATLANLIRSQLSPMFRRLVGYHRAGQNLNVVDPAAAPSDHVLILGRPLASFDSVVRTGLNAAEWPAGVERAGWGDFVAIEPTELARYAGAYGSSNDPADLVNRLATHSVFTAAHETFLAVFTRLVDDAERAVAASFELKTHAPHYALFLAFLRLLEHTRAEANGLTARHLDFYYRKVLQLSERPAEKSQAHVLVELAKHVKTRPIAAGTKLKAGKDDKGADAHFAVDRELIANKASVTDIRNLYRHRLSESVDELYAMPVADTDRPWHPFVNKDLADGSIDMPRAEVGFAIASHYLWLAEGTRRITLWIEHDGEIDGLVPVHLTCRITTEKGWLRKPAKRLAEAAPNQLALMVQLVGDDPPVTPYDPKVHGYGFAPGLPVLIIEESPDAPGPNPRLDTQKIAKIRVFTDVRGLRTLALSNDLGPVDGSKPFQPYGATPIAGSRFIIGSKEVFQKSLTSLTVKPQWIGSPATHPANAATPAVQARFLGAGAWQDLAFVAPADTGFNAASYSFQTQKLRPVAAPEISENAPLTTASRDGFIQLSLTTGFGFDAYPIYLAHKIANRQPPDPAPVAPVAASLTIDYTAEQTIDLGPTNKSDVGPANFFHITPFGGHTEPARDGNATLFPTFRTRGLASERKDSEGELYIGVRDLEPPQNLALLFQVVDGTANPRAAKPKDHVEWSYLCGNEWVEFAPDAVGDLTDGLLTSGIVTLAVPGEADTDHTVLPAGLHWMRLAVSTGTDAVCLVTKVAAQALKASYVVLDNQATSHTRELPAGTITKLDPPDAAVKSVSQLFPTFGGRPAETDISFATRVSERLRHKDRAITMWDYEHLILERFPGIFEVHCLNHTHYEPTDSGGIYRELAPGHVTVVTIPDLPNPHDPLRPYTSLGVLSEIEHFLAQRLSCFVTLHVRNPQFEEVCVNLRVRLRDGKDETFHTNLLRREITEFLSPWAFNREARPTFNGKVHKSRLVNFVEEREYVDYVTDVELSHRIPGKEDATVDEVVGSRAVSILVSVPANEHGIAIIDQADAAARETCACAPAVTS